MTRRFWFRYWPSRNGSPWTVLRFKSSRSRRCSTMDAYSNLCCPAAAAPTARVNTKVIAVCGILRAALLVAGALYILKVSGDTMQMYGDHQFPGKLFIVEGI